MRKPTYLSQRSTYLRHLPAIYSEGDFIGRFLMIFEEVLGPLEDTASNIAYYFDPLTTPSELLPWLASWLDLVLDENWPLARRRELAKSALELFQWRGTRRGLREYLRLYTGAEPKITENFGGILLGERARLGLSTILGVGKRHTFTVTLELEDSTSVEEEWLKAIIEAEKPAHAGYILQLVRKEFPGEGKLLANQQSNAQNG